MRKLLPIEQRALDVLNYRGPLTPGGEPGDFPHVFMRDTLDALVKKKRATVENDRRWSALHGLAQ